MLSPGGAERVAVHIVNGLNRERFEPIVISFADPMNCDLDELLSQAGVEVRYLAKKSGFDYRMYRRLHRVLTEYQPDVVHTHLQVMRYALPTMLLLGNAKLLPHRPQSCGTRDRTSRPSRSPLRVQPWRHSNRRGGRGCCQHEAPLRIPQCKVIANCIPTSTYANPGVIAPAVARAGRLCGRRCAVCFA